MNALVVLMDKLTVYHITVRIYSEGWWFHNRGQHIVAGSASPPNLKAYILQ
jgi:hypothetical protein